MFILRKIHNRKRRITDPVKIFIELIQDSVLIKGVIRCN